MSTRPVGSEHSRVYANAISAPEAGVSEVSAAADELVTVDTLARTVTAAGGKTFKQCRQTLERASLVLRGTPEADSVSLGGAIAVGAHGGGRHNMPVSGYVTQIWIRDGRGRLVRLRASDADFAAAAVSLGLLGTIEKVTLQAFKPEHNRQVTGTTIKTYSGAGLSTASDDTHSFQFAPYIHRMVRYDEHKTADAAPNCLASAYTCVRTVAAAPCVIFVVDCLAGCCPPLACVLSQAFVCPGTCAFGKFHTFTPTPKEPAFSVCLSYASLVGARAGESCETWVKIS
jgi:hypothetical protein